MRFVTLILLVISFSTCRSPDQEIIGKWKVVKTFINDQDVTQTNSIYETEFLPNKKLINYYNGEADDFESASYKIKNDTLYITVLRKVLDGIDTINKKLHLLLDDNKLKVGSNNFNYTEYMRETNDKINSNINNENTSIIKKRNKKGIRKYMVNDFEWTTNLSKDSKNVLKLTLHIDDASYQINKCSNHFDINLTSDTTINLRWQINFGCQNISDKLIFDIPDERIRVKKYPHNGDIFATYTLTNDTTLRVKYYFPEWTEKVNLYVKDSIFPTYFHL